MYLFQKNNALKVRLDTYVTQEQEMKTAEANKEVLARDAFGTPGAVGQTGEANTPPSLYIFNTTGVISSVNKNQSIVVVQGSGSNFEDGATRTLTIQVTPETFIRNTKTNKSKTGLSGLDLLEAQMTVLVSSTSNIRGYDNFVAQSINVME